MLSFLGRRCERPLRGVTGAICALDMGAGTSDEKVELVTLSSIRRFDCGSTSHDRKEMRRRQPTHSPSSSSSTGRAGVSHAVVEFSWRVVVVVKASSGERSAGVGGGGGAVGTTAKARFGAGGDAGAGAG